MIWTALPAASGIFPLASDASPGQPQVRPTGASCAFSAPFTAAENMAGSRCPLIAVAAIGALAVAVSWWPVWWTALRPKENGSGLEDDSGTVNPVPANGESTPTKVDKEIKTILDEIERLEGSP